MVEAGEQARAHRSHRRTLAARRARLWVRGLLDGGLPHPFAAHHPRRSALRGLAFLAVVAFLQGHAWAGVTDFASADEELAPPPGVGELAHRVLPAVSGPTGAGGYVFGLTQAASAAPVTYDPCRPVHFVVNVASAPPGSLALVQSAVRRISAATGLQLVDDGLTDEPASGARESFQPERYGARWAPVLIAWSDAKATPELAGDVLGSAGSDPRRDSRGHLSYVTGDVTLDAPELSEMMRADGGDASAFTLILHELGHVVGLDHSPDATQVMYFETDGQTQFGTGDRRGLAHVGAGACAPHL